MSYGQDIMGLLSFDVVLSSLRRQGPRFHALGMMIYFDPFVPSLVERLQLGANLSRLRSTRTDVG